MKHANYTKHREMRKRINKQGRMHGSIGRVRLGSGSKQSLQVFKQQNTHKENRRDQPTDQQANKQTNQWTTRLIESPARDKEH